MSADILAINNRLKEYYGRDEGDRPYFRVVWSDGLLEKRYGTFDEFYGSVFLRSTTGVAEVPKYTYVKSKYVLEKLVKFNMFQKPPELIGENWSYEPIYVFQDKNGKALPVVWRVIELIMRSILSGRPEKKTLASFEADEKEQEEKDIRYFEEAIDISPLAVALRGGGNSSGIIVPSNYRSL